MHVEANVKTVLNGGLNSTVAYATWLSKIPGRGGGGVLGFSFAGYVSLASQSPSPFLVYFVAS